MMNPPELKKLRLRSRISLIELAAHAGLPAEYLAKIEGEEVVPLESDLARMEKALRQIVDQHGSLG